MYSIIIINQSVPGIDAFLFSVTLVSKGNFKILITIYCRAYDNYGDNRVRFSVLIVARQHVYLYDFVYRKIASSNLAWVWIELVVFF